MDLGGIRRLYLDVYKRQEQHLQRIPGRRISLLYGFHIQPDILKNHSLLPLFHSVSAYVLSMSIYGVKYILFYSMLSSSVRQSVIENSMEI